MNLVMDWGFGPFTPTQTSDPLNVLEGGWVAYLAHNILVPVLSPESNFGLPILDLAEAFRAGLAFNLWTRDSSL